MKKIWKIIKENKVASIMVSCLVIVLLFSFSYAYFRAQDESNPQNITTANLDINYIDGESLNFSNEVPITDDEIDEYAASHSFSIKNNNDFVIYFDIGLNDLEISSAFKSGDLKWMLKEGNIIIEGGDFSNVATSDYSFKKSIELKPNETKTYILLIWIKDSGGDQTYLMNSSLGGKISVTGYTKGTPQNYVTNGLVLHYDGINNTGYGHSNNATTWKDLSESNNGILNRFDFDEDSGWQNDSIYINMKNIDGSKLDNQVSFVNLEKTLMITTGNWTAEVVLVTEREDRWQHVFNYNNTQFIGYHSNCSWVYYQTFENDSTVIYFLSNFNSERLPVPGEKYSNTVRYSYDDSVNNINVNININDEPIVNRTRNSIPSNASSFIITSIGGRTTGRSFIGKIYSVRIYDRVLTDEEVNQNYNADKIRFGLE